MERRISVSDFNNLRNLGKYLKFFRDKSDGEFLVGKCYFAGGALVDRAQSNANQDKQLVRAFAKTLKQIIEDPTKQNEVEDLAVKFAKICDIPRVSSTVYPSSWPSLYEESREIAPEYGYADLGKRLISASDSLKKRLPQTDGSSIDYQAARIIQRYIKN